MGVGAFLFDPRGHLRVRELAESLGAEILVTTLEAGDVNFFAYGNRSVGIELKKVDDLLASLRSGRLFEQAAGLISTCDFPLLLTFGFLTCAKGGECHTRTGLKPHPPWPTYLQLMNAILSLGEHGMTVLPFVPNEWLAAQLLLSIQKWFEKKSHRSILKRQVPFTMGDQREVQSIHILSGIRRVNVGLAKKLLEAFGTPLAVLSATEEELRAVKGIGKAIAGAVFRAARAQ